MDKNVERYLKQRVERTIKKLESNNMEGYFVEDEKELIDKINSLVKEEETVSVGGSVTLKETGILEYLRNGRYQFFDRYKEGLTKEDIKNIYRESFCCNTYFVSTNALTENGELFNIDGNGNRVAAMIYGPDQVIVVCGINKIVKDLDEARLRVKNYAAPINAQRLDRGTPCTKVGYCVDCHSEGRICSHYVVMGRQNIKNKGRVKVIIVNKELGY